MTNKQNSLCPEFWDWLPKAYRNSDVGDEPRFTKYNMEVAFLAGKQSAALEAKDEPVQVSPLQFVEMVMEKEDCIGKPIFWAEWPNKENT